MTATEQTRGTHWERRVGWPDRLVAPLRTLAFTLQAGEPWWDFDHEKGGFQLEMAALAAELRKQERQGGLLKGYSTNSDLGGQ